MELVWQCRAYTVFYLHFKTLTSTVVERPVFVAFHAQSRWDDEHVVLSASEKRKVADRYGIDKLPRISVTDPVARWLDLGRGTIVKIEEASPEGHLVTEYRVVT